MIFLKIIFLSLCFYIALSCYGVTLILGQQIDLVKVLGNLTDVIGLNQYYGWYEGTVNELGYHLDTLHSRFPQLRIITSEYGAGAVKGWHSSKPSPQDFSEEYQLHFHKSYIKQLAERPWYPGAFIWTQFDFGAEWRKDGVPHLNNKGLMDFNRKPKAAYFFYRNKWGHSTNSVHRSLINQQLAKIKQKILQLHSSSKRVIIPLNKKWYFKLEGQKQSIQVIDLPHSWNVVDAFDEQPGYFRGTGTYIKRIKWPLIKSDQILLLNIRGAGQKTRIILDGQVVAEHIGMFLGFKVNVTNFAIRRQESILVIEVNNDNDLSIPPVEEADYNIYGGLYRGVALEILPQTHINHIKINAHKHQNGEYELIVKASVKNWRLKNNSKIEIELYDFDNNRIPLTILTKENKKDFFKIIAKPCIPIKEWSPIQPNLYLLSIKLKHKATILDEVRSSVGFKTFEWDIGALPRLNGKEFYFKGTSRHQDKAQKANALTLDDHILDLLLIKEMGANAIRLAHYPQDPLVLDICDIVGLLVWEEIPVTSGVPAIPQIINHQLQYLPHPVFLRHAEQYLRTMIKRDYNHTSIIFWGLANEILTERSSLWRINVAQNILVKLNDIAKHEDPYRLTAQAI